MSNRRRRHDRLSGPRAVSWPGGESERFGTDDDHDRLPPAPRVRELMAEGISRQDAEHLCVLELALEVVRLDLPGAIPVVARHAAIALLWPEVREQAAHRYTGPGQRAAWRRLGACVPRQARQPFDALADGGDHSS